MIEFIKRFCVGVICGMFVFLTNTNYSHGQTVDKSEGEEILSYLDKLSALDDLAPNVLYLMDLVDELKQAESEYRASLSVGDSGYAHEYFKEVKAKLDSYLKSFDEPRQVWTQLGNIQAPQSLQDAHKKILRGLQNLNWALSHFKNSHFDDGKKEAVLFLKMYEQSSAWLKDAVYV